MPSISASGRGGHPAEVVDVLGKAPGAAQRAEVDDARALPEGGVVLAGGGVGESDDLPAIVDPPGDGIRPAGKHAQVAHPPVGLPEDRPETAGGVPRPPDDLPGVVEAVGLALSPARSLQRHDPPGRTARRRAWSAPTGTISRIAVRKCRTAGQYTELVPPSGGSRAGARALTPQAASRVPSWQGRCTGRSFPKNRRWTRPQGRSARNQWPPARATSNCSSSVEPRIAAVETSPPAITFATSSK